MNKKTLPIILTLILLLIVFVGGYYIYNSAEQNNILNNNKSSNNQTNDQCQGDECNNVQETVDSFDGVFDRAEEGVIYFKPKGSEQVKSVTVNQQTAFAELILKETSGEYQTVSEKNISSSDLIKGDNISVFMANLNNSDENILGLASKINRVVLEGEAGQINNNQVLDGTFNRIEDGLVYFQADKTGSLETAKITNETAFVKLTMSASFETLSKETISSTAFNSGDDVTVFGGYDSNEQLVATQLMQIIVLDE